MGRGTSSKAPPSWRNPTFCYILINKQTFKLFISRGEIVVKKQHASWTRQWTTVTVGCNCVTSTEEGAFDGQRLCESTQDRSTQSVTTTEHHCGLDCVINSWVETDDETNGEDLRQTSRETIKKCLLLITCNKSVMEKSIQILHQK